MPKTEKKNNTEKKVRSLTGVVISQKMKDTAVVSVGRFVKHPKYKKYYKVNKKYKVHDVGNTKEVGEKVEIVPCRPISKDKHFTMLGTTVN